MIITCINCNKKFDVDPNLIPSKGRSIQCGLCNHVWFFKKDDILVNEVKSEIVHKNIDKTQIEKKKDKNIDIDKKFNNDVFRTIDKKKALVKYSQKSSFSLGRLISYLIVFFISLIAIILLLDTFKYNLITIFPKIEFFLFNVFETLRDMKLFLNDLIR